MLVLDPRTIVLLAGVMGALMSMVIFSLRRNFPPTIKGLGEWAAGPAVIFVATLMLGGRGAIPDLFSMVIANLLVLTGLALLYLGTQRFLGLPPALRTCAALVIVAAPVLAWNVHVIPHYGRFLMAISLFIAALSLAHARVLVLHGARSFATYLTVTALLILSVTQVLRFAFALGLPAEGTLFNLPPSQSALIAIYAFATLMIPVGMVLMATDKLRNEIELLASRDFLTGAMTRRALIKVCELELERCRRMPSELSLLMMDLDHFKAINDTHGHLTGDRVLVDFAARVMPLIRRPDSLGRFGGEEFVALLPGTSLDGALVVAERIRAEIADTTGEPSCTVSIGVTTRRSGDSSVNPLLARADDALYQAKAAGRNCVRASV